MDDIAGANTLVKFRKRNEDRLCSTILQGNERKGGECTVYVADARCKYMLAHQVLEVAMMTHRTVKSKRVLYSQANTFVELQTVIKVSERDEIERLG